MWHTRVKEKITRRLGPAWRAAALARKAAIIPEVVSRALQCTGDAGCKARHTPNVQDAIAAAVGMSTAALFGPHAWHKIVAHHLRSIERRKRKAS